jgi:hypothetical protein
MLKPSEFFLSFQEERVAIAAQNVARQRELVSQLERDGHNASQAQKMLDQFLEQQALHIADRDNFKQASYKPTAEEAAKAKALINFMMQDQLFLALYRSNDPKVRAVAMDKLNNAHYQAYGDAPAKDDDAGLAPPLLLSFSCKVMTEYPFEIPQAARDVSEQSLKQVHAAYAQLMDFMTQAMNAWTGALPASPTTAGLKDVQARAMEIAMENSESVFTFASNISNAQTFHDIVTLQAQFAQDRMQTFTTQRQELYKLIGETDQKLQRGSSLH